MVERASSGHVLGKVVRKLERESVRWEERERCGSRDLFGWEKIGVCKDGSWWILEMVFWF